MPRSSVVKKRTKIATYTDFYLFNHYDPAVLWSRLNGSWIACADVCWNETNESDKRCISSEKQNRIATKIPTMCGRCAYLFLLFGTQMFYDQKTLIAPIQQYLV